MSRHELRNGVGEGGIRVDVEDGEGVAAMLDAALGEDDGDEVHTGRLEQGSAGGVGEVPHVGSGDVANDVLAVVDDGDARQAFGVHEGEGLGEGRIRAGAVSHVPKTYKSTQDTHLTAMI